MRVHVWLCMAVAVDRKATTTISTFSTQKSEYIAVSTHKHLQTQYKKWIITFTLRVSLTYNVTSVQNVFVLMVTSILMLR